MNWLTYKNYLINYNKNMNSRVIIVKFKKSIFIFYFISYYIAGKNKKYKYLKM